jgi:hypothetical protein
MYTIVLMSVFLYRSPDLLEDLKWRAVRLIAVRKSSGPAATVVQNEGTMKAKQRA